MEETSSKTSWLFEAGLTSSPFFCVVQSMLLSCNYFPQQILAVVTPRRTLVFIANTLLLLAKLEKVFNFNSIKSPYGLIPYLTMSSFPILSNK